jgi:hypothetical protein
MICKNCGRSDDKCHIIEYFKEVKSTEEFFREAQD